MTGMLKRDKGWWWRGMLFLAGLLFLTPLRTLAIQTTSIQDVVYRADGSLAQGTMLVSWSSFTAVDGSTVAAGTMTVTIAPDGSVSMALAPNAGAEPQGSYYTVVYHLNDGTVQKEYWVVPQAPMAKIADMRARVVPAAVAQQSVSPQYVNGLISNLQTSYLQLKGGTLSGALNLAADPTSALQAATKEYVDAHIGAILPAAQNVIAGNGSGNAVSMTEKGVNVQGANGMVAWDEDLKAGRYDARNPKYAGGLYGPNPTAALQAVEDQINCDMAMGLTQEGVVILPPGTFGISHIEIAPGSYFGGTQDGLSSKTVLWHTQNNTTMLHVAGPRTTSCSDGQQHTNSADHTGIGHLQVNGCGEGGCSNAPGDTADHPTGGPLDEGIDIEDYQGVVEWVQGSYFGGTAIHIGGQDSQGHHLFTYLNNEWYLFGKGVAGQTYDPSTDGYHGDVELDSLDGQYDFIEVYGTFISPGVEYGHIGDIMTAGGDSSFMHLWPQLGEIGILQPYGLGANNRFTDFRVDFSEGDGIQVGDVNLTFLNGIVDGHCISQIAQTAGHCDALNVRGLGDRFFDVLLVDNPGFGPTNKTGDIFPFTGGTYRNVQGTFETPVGYSVGQAVDRDYVNSSISVIGPAPDVSVSNKIRPVDTAPIQYTSLTNPFSDEDIWIYGGNSNVTLLGTANGGAWKTCNGGQNVNLGNAGVLHFVVTTGSIYGLPPTLTEQCDVPAGPPIPSSATSSCNDGDQTFGAGPSSVGGAGWYICHPTNTWTFYALSPTSTSF